MDSAMGELTDENMVVSDTSSGNISGRVNGEVNGLADDTLASPATKGASLKAVSAISDHITEVLSSDDESINSVENGVEEVPRKDSKKRSEPGTKVPQSKSVLPSSKMDIDVSDSDESVSAIEESDPLLAATAARKSAIGNGKAGPDTKKVTLTNNSKHSKPDGATRKENGGADRGKRDADAEEASNDSARSGAARADADGSEADKDSDQLDSPAKDGDSAPGKIKKSRKSVPDANVTPRRSSRNLTRVQKTYSDPDPADDAADEREEPAATAAAAADDDESEVEEITMVDPLADPKPIIVKDTRKLVEIAAGARSMKGGAKKEPTLVIIDTNSILAGRGPVPMAQTHRSVPSTSTVRSSQGYTILPVSLSAQGMAYPKSRPAPQAYNQAYNRLTPIPVRLPIHKPTPPPPPPPPQILPTLTDDMYVVEAPSFIVPYVYEKPPLKPLKEYVKKMGVELERLTKLEEEEEKKKEEEEAKEKAESGTTKESGDVKKDKVDKDSAKTVKEGDDKEVANKPKADDGSKKNKSEESKGDETKTAKEKTDDEVKNQAKTKEDAKAKKDKDGDADSEDADSDDEESAKAKEDKAKTPAAAAADKEKSEEEKLKNSYFENPLGKFFMNIGTNLVTEYVQTDLLRHQRRKRDREGHISASAQFAVNALLSNLELSKENNKPFHLPVKKCEHCSFKTESAMVMAQHLETPHMRNYVYRCNFCPLEVRNPPDILFHMEAEHNVRGRLERALAFHQCPNCPFEDNQKGKLSRHLMSCAKKFKPERNLEPPTDWEPPAKIPRVSRNRPTSMGLGTAAYQAMIAKQQVPGQSLLPKVLPSAYTGMLPVTARGRGRPTVTRPELNVMTPSGQRSISQMRPGMMYRPSGSGTQAQVISSYQIAGNQLFHVVGSQGQMIPLRSALAQQGSAAAAATSIARPISLLANLAAQGNTFSVQGSSSKSAASRGMPSISITPLPRQAAVASTQAASATSAHSRQSPQGQQTTTAVAGKNYVICEICDGYIKDLEQLRNHMLWIHKVKIHPKMIHNRPPLNCQKCQCRFFTDQGLERHLLGTHGLVTSSMQEAANKGKDAGRCPACGRVYQWKLLSHVARDHGMVLKPAHLSYKCTVCTATFGMYKQFENHVYSAHSTQAKKVMDKKPSSSTQAFRPMSTEGSKSLLKPLKMNDEITIIPQPAASSRVRAGPASKTGRPNLAAPAKTKVYQCPLCPCSFDGTPGFSQYLVHVRRRHLVGLKVKTCRLDTCNTCKEEHVTEEMLDYLEERRRGVDVIELSDDEVVIAGQGRNEITITKVACSPGPRRYKHRLQQKNRNVHVIEIEDSPVKGGEEPKENGEDSLTAVKERLRRRKSLEISQVDSDFPEAGPSRKRRRHNN